MTQQIKGPLIKATQFAMNNEWDAAHDIAQSYHHEAAYWLHAVLHKVEGDAANSRYWYAKTKGITYADFTDEQAELKGILRVLDALE